jgi:hypothetical protein
MQVDTNHQFAGSSPVRDATQDSSNGEDTSLIKTEQKFESFILHNTLLAQRPELLVYIHRVGGPNPSESTNARMLEWYTGTA